MAERFAAQIRGGSEIGADMKIAVAKHGPRAESVAVQVSEMEIAPLDPDQLRQMAEGAMRTLLAEGESDNAIRSYQIRWSLSRSAVGWPLTKAEQRSKTQFLTFERLRPHSSAALLDSRCR